MNIDEEGDLAISLGFAIAMGLAALFAVVMTKPEINQEVASILDDGLKFIEDTIKFNITMKITTLMLVYSALDNVMMNKQTGNQRDSGLSKEFPDTTDGNNNLEKVRKKAHKDGNRQLEMLIVKEQKARGQRNKRKNVVVHI